MGPNFTPEQLQLLEKFRLMQQGVKMEASPGTPVSSLMTRRGPTGTQQLWAGRPLSSYMPKKASYEVGVILALEDAGVVEKTAIDIGGTPAGGLGGRSLTQGMRSGMGRAPRTPKQPQGQSSAPRAAAYGTKPMSEYGNKPSVASPVTGTT